MTPILDPNEVPTLSTKELLEKKEQLEEIINSAEEDILGIRGEILARLQETKLESDKVDKWLITRYPETTFKTSIEEARQFDAVKTVEKVDTDILKKVAESGTKVPGMTVREKLRIAVVKEAKI